MMMFGPVHAGVHGDPSSMKKFDENDNLLATVTFDRYLATLAEWMHVEAKDVLNPMSGGRMPGPIGGLIKA